MSESELRELLDFGVGVARGAGQITLRYFRQKFDARRKANQTFVTEIGKAHV